MYVANLYSKYICGARKVLEVLTEFKSVSSQCSFLEKGRFFIRNYFELLNVIRLIFI